MTIYQKFGFYFLIALSLHLGILGLFGLNVESEPELIQHKPIPEIIRASILDDEKILQEAHRLKSNEENKRVLQKKQQTTLENKRKKEQKLLLEAKKKRHKEEKKLKALEKKRKNQAVKEKKRLEKVKKQKVLEAARLAKIKTQQVAEKKRKDELRKKEDEKRELARQAEQKKQQILLETQKRLAADKAAKLKRQANEKRAEQGRDKKSTVTSTAAIMQKVTNRWIRPLSSVKGLTCKVRVKLLPSGDVMDVQVIKSSGDAIFDRSAENAVRKASPLPVPTKRALFSQHFRTFTFNFKPE